MGLPRSRGPKSNPCLSRSLEAVGNGLAEAPPYVQRLTTHRGVTGNGNGADGGSQSYGQSYGYGLRTMTSRCPPHPR